MDITFKDLSPAHAKALTDVYAMLIKEPDAGAESGGSPEVPAGQATALKAETPAPAPTKRRGRPRKPPAEPKNDSPVTPTAPAVMPATAAQANSGEGHPTIEDARSLVHRIFKEKDGGLEVSLDLLARYGVTRVDDLKPEQIADFVTEAKGMF